MTGHWYGWASNAVAHTPRFNRESGLFSFPSSSDRTTVISDWSWRASI
jgi:hypothetical protein